MHYGNLNWGCWGFFMLFSTLTNPLLYLFSNCKYRCPSTICLGPSLPPRSYLKSPLFLPLNYAMTQTHISVLHVCWAPKLHFYLLPGFLYLKLCTWITRVIMYISIPLKCHASKGRRLLSFTFPPPLHAVFTSVHSIIS